MVCTRCGCERAEAGRKWCGTCLAVESDKRDARTGADERRRLRIERRRDLIRAALQRIEARTPNAELTDANRTEKNQ